MRVRDKNGREGRAVETIQGEMLCRCLESIETVNDLVFCSPNAMSCIPIVIRIDEQSNPRWMHVTLNVNH